MSNRREFIKKISHLAIGLSLLAGSVNLIAQPERLEVTLNGSRIKTIDIHAHLVVPEVADLLTNTVFSEISFAPWQALSSDRIDLMDERGIDVQALSINRYWWYAAERDLASRIVKLHDEHLANWVNQHPNRFVALSSVALQYPDLAAQQLEYAMNELGHKGASIGGHVLGSNLADPKYDVFWAKAEELQAPIFMHPDGAKNVIKEGSLSGRGELNNIIGNPLETTIFLSQLIYGGVFDRFPNLKVVAAHGGGYMPSYLGRSEVACQVRPNADCLNEKNPSDYLKEQIFVDTIVFDHEGLRHLVATVGSSQVVYGTDAPFNWPDSIDTVMTSPSLSDSEKEAILGGNLGRLLKIK
ncbi:MAG: hypothetical protein CMQ51_01020 [Gammaproteobacteria bacterium]|nr:hypothetical protein [Gammaproteobacteria bacterium]|tara:strand:+ start:8104 stop:9168 length:1065 start_codon:yes stop_codon:yes gene_type:complete